MAVGYDRALKSKGWRSDSLAASVVQTQESPAFIPPLKALRGMSPERSARIYQLMRPRTIEKGAWLSLDQHFKNRVAFVQSGSYRIAIISTSGMPVSIRSIGAGDHFGEVGAFTDAPLPHFHLIADTGGIVHEMMHADLAQLLELMPEFSANFLRALSTTSITQSHRIYEFACLGVRARLLAELLRLAGSRNDDQALIDPAPSHAALASEIGATREVVSRHLKIFQVMGLIAARRGRISMLSLSRARSEVEQELGVRPN